MSLVIKLEQCTIQQGGKEILTDVNIALEQGQFAYLVGKTGSGKSSLLKTLYGALPLEKGDGEVAGFNLSNLNNKSTPKLRRKLGIIFQDFNLLTDRSVNDNLDFVLRATDWTSRQDRKRRIQEVLEAVNLLEKKDEMPFQLSGGEQQRIVIARALLNKPTLFLADEPTGNLDPETSDDILDLLTDVCKETGAAMLLATHDYRIIDNFPQRVIRCKNGQIINEESNII